MTGEELEERFQKMTEPEDDWRKHGVVYKYHPEYVKFPEARIKVTLSNGEEWDLPLIVERHHDCADPKCPVCLIVESLRPGTDPKCQPVPLVRFR